MRRSDRIAQLERAAAPAKDWSRPVLVVNAGESEEEAAIRHGIDSARVLYVIPSNGREPQ